MFDAIGKAFSSAVNTIGEIAKVAAPILFPGPTLALTAGNLLAQAVGGGVQQAVSQLAKEGGLPKFLLGPVGGMIADVVAKFCRPSDSGCDHAVQEHCGNDFRDFGDSIRRSVLDAIRQCRGEGEEGGSDSWLVAIAKAMGKVAGQHAKELATLSKKLDQLKGDDPNNAQQSQEITNKMQGESQMLNLLQTAFSNVLKSIGEATANMARKG